MDRIGQPSPIGEIGGYMELNEYLVKYPNYCRKCKGWGMFTPHMAPFHDCEECVENEICARCGTHPLDEMNHCSSCGWTMLKDEGLLGGNS